MSLRHRLAEQQRLLTAFPWPPWVNYGVPGSAILLAAMAIVDQTVRDGLPATSAASIAASGLIALSVVPWVTWLAGDRRMRVDFINHPLAFGSAVIVPLAVLNVGGDWLGIADVEPAGPQISFLILILLVGQSIAHASLVTSALIELAVIGVILGRFAQATVADAGFGSWLAGLVIATLVGLALRANFANLARLREARERVARQAVTAERRRVASEVHDVVAHTLSVSMLHVSAARLAVERSPAQALESLEEAEHQGRLGMADIRRMVRLLRSIDDDFDDGSAAAVAGQPDPVARALPTLDELEELVASYETAGLRVESDVDRLAGVSPSTGLALYRVVQESLTNAARYGAGPAQLRLAVESDRAWLTVRNPCAGVPGDTCEGTGLLGMRERVTGLGGTFRAGPANGVDGDGHVWLVEACLPAGAAP